MYFVFILYINMGISNWYY